jgi:hypothetical protein
MSFTRSIPARPYVDYTRYLPLLRRDFRHRYTYGLTHEFFLVGEAGCDIDHHRSRRGPFARPDLEAVYENLYWCCRECDQNKGDLWPTDEEFTAGLRFLDPCRPEDDHDHHWRTNPDGTLVPLTVTGEYTIERLMLWREMLVFHRARCDRWQQERDELRTWLATRRVSDEQRARLESCLIEFGEWIEPPVFHRPRRSARRH